MANILLVYSSHDGHTLEIAERLAGWLREDGHALTLAEIPGEGGPDPAAFDKVVIGAAIRYGRHSPRVSAWVERHRQALDQRPNAFFSVNLVARKPHRNSPDTNPYMRLFLKRIHWRPQHLAVFAGKLNYPLYGFLDRQIIRLIMRISGGPTDPSTVKDYTDWERVREFASLLSSM